MKANPRQIALLLIASIAALAIAIPVMGADPCRGHPSPPGQVKPDRSAKPVKSDNPGQHKKVEKAAAEGREGRREGQDSRDRRHR